MKQWQWALIATTGLIVGLGLYWTTRYLASDGAQGAPNVLRPLLGGSLTADDEIGLYAGSYYGMREDESRRADVWVLLDPYSIPGFDDFKAVVGQSYRGSPAGPMLAKWALVDYDAEKWKAWEAKERVWLDKKFSGPNKSLNPDFKEPKPPSPGRSRERYFYAVAPASLFKLPPRTDGHRQYELYFAAAKLLLHESAMRPADIEGADQFPLYVGMRYRFGRDDTLYYKLRSVAPNADGSVPSIERDPTPWGEIRGIPITKAQYERMDCAPSRGRSVTQILEANPYMEHEPEKLAQLKPDPPCYPFLRETDPDLTPEQRAYVHAHPLSLDDFSKIIERLSRGNPWK